jgi:hypothetical protein
VHPAHFPREEGGYYPEDSVNWEDQPRMPIVMESVDGSLLDWEAYTVDVPGVIPIVMLPVFEGREGMFLGVIVCFLASCFSHLPRTRQEWWIRLFIFMQAVLPCCSCI